MSFSSYHSRGLSAVSSTSLRSTSFDSGGRSYGRWTSSLTSVMGPEYSDFRSCSAVRAAANPPPTITIPLVALASVLTWSS